VAVIRMALIVVAPVVLRESCEAIPNLHHDAAIV
jgi:hypothetical protein